MQIDEEQILLNKVSKGDEIAFELVFNLYRNKVYGYAMRLSQSETQSEEIVQNIFLQLWVNRTSLNKINNFAGYVRVMARNEALQFLRRLAMEQRHQVSIARNWTEEDNETEFVLQYNEANRILTDTLNTLPPQQKLIYNLCHLQGVKQQEVAVQLHISPLTVKAHLRQAVLKIRKALFVKGVSALLTILTIFF